MFGLDPFQLKLFSQLALAAFLGVLIGLERSYVRKAAGFRTYSLIALGSCLFTILSQSGFAGENADPTRIAAQIVTGIGFIGAGLIIFQEHKIQGLTTAAGLWATAAIGMAIGMGFYQLAILASLLILVILSIFSKLEFKLREERENK